MHNTRTSAPAWGTPHTSGQQGAPCRGTEASEGTEGKAGQTGRSEHSTPTRAGGRGQAGQRRGKEEGTAADLTIPSTCWASLAEHQVLFQPGPGPGPWAASGCSAHPAVPSPLPWGMSLPINYEGLRHQIEKLVRENEELKKLVRLIRENHELKSAIKTQASSFNSGLCEVATGTPQNPGVFLPAVAATEPALEELGVVALADMLSGPQPGPSAGPLVGALGSPLGPLLAGPVPVQQAGPFAGLLAAPLAGPGAAALPGALGLAAAGPVAASLSNPLVAPAAGPVSVSLSSPLLAAAPPPGAPARGPGLPEAPRVRLAEPPRAAPPAPHPSASAGLAAPKVNDARGPRATEPTPRKAVQEPDRKAAHRKAGRFPDASREPKQLAWERLVGEIAFQLDRRILSSIFPERVRLYGFTVSNIPEKIIQASLNPTDHKLDEELCQTLTQRYVSIMNRLQTLGYNGRVHPALTEQLVNAYGILRERPELAASEGGCYTVDFLQRVLVDTVHPSMLTDALLLLSCLSQLAHDDGKPMFIW
ncbi:speriolin-like [Dipodomys merriami]|uniref:speriolin-like n=1 Tax=Dipodomys merriami TaxID=94247 RepID=UPI003855F672